jgi:hypothetical protein
MAVVHLGFPKVKAAEEGWVEALWENYISVQLGSGLMTMAVLCELRVPNKQ